MGKVDVAGPDVGRVGGLLRQTIEEGIKPALSKSVGCAGGG